MNEANIAVWLIVGSVASDVEIRCLENAVVARPPELKMSAPNVAAASCVRFFGLVSHFRLYHVGISVYLSLYHHRMVRRPWYSRGELEKRPVMRTVK